MQSIRNRNAKKSMLMVTKRKADKNRQQQRRVASVSSSDSDDSDDSDDPYLVKWETNDILRKGNSDVYYRITGIASEYCIAVRTDKEGFDLFNNNDELTKYKSGIDVYSQGFEPLLIKNSSRTMFQVQKKFIDVLGNKLDNDVLGSQLKVGDYVKWESGKEEAMKTETKYYQIDREIHTYHTYVDDLKVFNQYYTFFTLKEKKKNGEALNSGILEVSVEGFDIRDNKTQRALWSKYYPNKKKKRGLRFW
tara:strand:- start:188 stop:934 length:747 start_codon:yes stop_codon:yes gene_type:complete